MRLQRLELTGFKSFARTIALEFPSPVTAIVGPNGSGKSNIKEAIQWVLGEQSVKSLRGKKGEDLIWNGSPLVPRLGRAHVALHFDNADGRIPIDFSEVAIGRRIFRDGNNEYYLNDSEVRLKDISELTARMGLGARCHNIIGQGEVDRLLLATPQERRSMLEEALGLRIYHLKKQETERKLVSTESNMAQISGLLREIAPHVKYLRMMAEKAAQREKFEKELRMLERVFFVKEAQDIRLQRSSLADHTHPLYESSMHLDGEIAELQKKLEVAEQDFSSAENLDNQEHDRALGEIKRRELEREIGRLEGRLEAERQKIGKPKVGVIDMRFVQSEIQEFLHEFKSILEEEEHLEYSRTHLLALVEDLEALLSGIERGTREEMRAGDEGAAIKSLQDALGVLHKELFYANEEAARYEAMRAREREHMKDAQQNVRAIEQALQIKKEEKRQIEFTIQQSLAEKDRIDAREEILARKLNEANLLEKDLPSSFIPEISPLSCEQIRYKIERIRGKLEDISGIDAETQKEYENTEKRQAFLSIELADLTQASLSLRKLIRELEEHLKDDFSKGLSRIKEEFNNYFRIIFGGGRASFEYIAADAMAMHGEREGEFYEEKKEIKDPGIEISVELPKKRIKGLQMLSGGEKALTSIALLFAITAVNPPPFLILDETDAALDEANSQRFSAVISELAHRTQLLLITHNRETMKAADILYGVTMGDDGVSRFLSLRFADAMQYTNR